MFFGKLYKQVRILLRRSHVAPFSLVNGRTKQHSREGTKVKLVNHVYLKMPNHTFSIHQLMLTVVLFCFDTFYVYSVRSTNTPTTIRNTMS